MKKFKTIDLCSGIGGIRRGFERAKCFENVLSAEIDKYARRTYKHIFHDAVEPEHDLTTPTFKEMASRQNYDVLLAGFPCQAFSRAGLKRGFEDETKGTIFHSIMEIVRESKPQAIFLENVDNLLSHDKLRTFSIILSSLDNAGYKIIGVNREDWLNQDGKFDPMLMDVRVRRKIFMRNTRNFGLPQNRPRVYIMAFRRDAFGPGLVDQIEDPLPESFSPDTRYPDLVSLLEKDVAYTYYIASGYLETLEDHRRRHSGNPHAKSGFGFMVLNDPEKAAPAKWANTIMATGGSGKERNMIYQPHPDYAGLPPEKTGKRTPINSKGLRFMTPVEWGRLQGFLGYGFVDEKGVDRFEFPEGISLQQQYKQFGNSVSIPVIEAMALFMRSCFERINAVPKSMKEGVAFVDEL